VVFLNKEVLTIALIAAGMIYFGHSTIVRACSFERYWIVLVFSLVFTFLIGLEVIK